MKELKFDDWIKIPEDGWGQLSSEEQYFACWEAARVGMIPEDEAVRIPKVEEWPEGAHYISIHFRTWDDDFAGVVHEDIPRPAPAWAPKAGEAVFYDNGCNVTTVKDGLTRNGLVSTNDFGFVRPDQIKPFDASKIGMKWEDIPGGVE